MNLRIEAQIPTAPFPDVGCPAFAKAKARQADASNTNSIEHRIDSPSNAQRSTLHNQRSTRLPRSQAALAGTCWRMQRVKEVIRGRRGKLDFVAARFCFSGRHRWGCHSDSPSPDPK